MQGNTASRQSQEAAKPETHWSLANTLSALGRNPAGSQTTVDRSWRMSERSLEKAGGCCVEPFRPDFYSWLGWKHRQHTDFINKWQGADGRREILNDDLGTHRHKETVQIHQDELNGT